MAPTLKQAQSLAFTVDAICASPLVSEYMIGYTARQGLKRRAEYSIHGYQHLVILADKLTRADALELEAALHSYIIGVRRMAVYRKYNKARRDGPHYMNAGNTSRDPGEHVHSIYMAWKDP